MDPKTWTEKTQDAFLRAQQLAEQRGNPELTPWHLCATLIDQEGGLVSTLLTKLHVSIPNFVEEVSAELDKLPKVQSQAGQVYPSPDLSKLLQLAAAQQAAFKDGYLSTEHLFLALLELGNDLSRSLQQKGIDEKTLKEAIMQIRGNQNVDSPNPENKYQTLEKYAKDLTQLAKDQKLDPVIGRDEEIRRVIQVLSRRSKNNPVLIGEPGVGKTAIAEGLAQRIVAGDVPQSLKDRKVVAMDLGALLAGAKFRGEFEDRLKALLNEVQKSDGEIILFIDELHTLMGAGAAEGAVDASNLLKPALARGELHCVGATTLKEYQKHIEKDAAFERRFQPVYVGEPSVEDAIAILRGLKERYELHHGVRIKDSAIVSAVTLSHRYISDRFLPDKAIDLIDESASRLRIEIDSVPTEIDALNRKVTSLEIQNEALKKEKDPASKARRNDLKKEIADLKEEVSRLNAIWMKEKEEISKVQDIKHKMDVLRMEMEQAEQQGNLTKAAELKYGKLPDLEAALGDAQASLANDGETGHRMLKEEVDSEDIAKVVSLWTGIPVSRMLESEKEKLKELEARLGKRVVGQTQALSCVSAAIRRSRAGLADPKRPIGSFLFLGPTGVGKTETVKALAEVLFDDDEAVLRIDMSEYMEKHAVARLIGAPPGYVGYDEGGYLTEAVRRRPYAVVLFDEIEKAHPDVFNVLLQVLDDGRLTDGQGRTVDFKNTVIIMTSNLGSDHILKAQEKGVWDHEKLQSEMLEMLKGHFRPEFLNRVDDIVLYNQLHKEEINAIVDLQLARLESRLEENNGLSIEVTDAAKALLGELGYDPLFGARPLKRAIQRYVENPLADVILDGQIQAGQTLCVDAKGGDISVDIKS